MSSEPAPPPAGLMLTLAAACGFAVANIYYNQPLLPLFAASFGTSAGRAGLIATVTQLGYALGLLLFVPLGDILSRRKLIILLLGCNILALLGCGLSPQFWLLASASLAVGVTAVSAQIIIPAASMMVGPERRGKVVGLMTSGLSSGILLGRTLSGVVAAHAGWRPMYGLAALLDLALIGLIALQMPATRGTAKIGYGALLASLWPLWRGEIVLRRAALTSALLFASFANFWAALAFLLARPPFFMGSDIAGLFGLAALVGVTISPFIGGACDRFGTSRVWLCGAAVNLASFAALLWGGSSLGVMILAALALDFGNRANLISNQTSIYRLPGEARSRLNTVFMVIHFSGGALGSACGAAASASGGTRGVALCGIGFVLAAITVHLIFARLTGSEADPAG